CGLTCRVPEQKWDCLREHAWQGGVPSAIDDRWLGVFATLVKRGDRGKVATYHLQRHPWLRPRFVRRFASSAKLTVHPKARTLDHFLRK
ncbi:MAG TPA: hypothetical protein VKK79_24115, partial [Candidatus Lokiarchaeia archaeon]|nr:hypothetical protein [Candidatus Lokiarchaeia archaeon]